MADRSSTHPALSHMSYHWAITACQQVPLHAADHAQRSIAPADSPTQDSTILNIIRWRAGWLGECLEGVCRAAGHRQAPQAACNSTRTSPVAAMMQWCCPCLFGGGAAPRNPGWLRPTPDFQGLFLPPRKTIMSRPAPSQAFPSQLRCIW